MRQNRNPILRCAVAEGKSGGHGSDSGESRTELRERNTGVEIAERPYARPACFKLANETMPCRRFSRKYPRRRVRGSARPDTP
jgi:hypothetical protein